MCGIAGEFRFDGELPEIKTLQMICNAMEKRGPDSSGVMQHGPIALGHRRLKIFDLSERGQQPMYDPHLGLGVVFNGAIYNFFELRSELEKEGYQFFSTTDTEIIIKAYHAWGKECVHRFNGMFAIAIWERDSNQLLLMRDRLGIKPLYYTINGKFLRFASSLPALLKSDNINLQINPEALHHYLMFHAIPEPHTMLTGIKKLKPGTILTVSSDANIREETYWKLKVRSKIEQSQNEDQWIFEFSQILTKSIRRQSIADVPIGLLLSGGLDSSLMAAILAQEMRGKLRTFSIGFDSSSHESGNEFFYSDWVARLFSSDHTKIHIKNDELLKTLDDCIFEMSEPMTSHDNVAFFLLSREVSKHLKVVQSGQGADEIFAGYYWLQQFTEIPKQIDPISYYASHVLDRTYAEYCDTIMPAYRTINYSRMVIENSFRENNSTSLVENALYFDSAFPLAEGPLKRVDNMTMAWSLESRVPFLDHELVEFAANMPLALKMRQGGKYILKKLAQTLLPVEVINRPKGYFPVPALKNLPNNYLNRIKQVLTPKQVVERGIFNPDYVSRLLSFPDKYMTPLNGSKLWQIAVLEMWLQVHNIS